jgi:hypothetical protein
MYGIREDAGSDDAANEINCSETASGLILAGGLIDVVDDQGVDRNFLGFELEA